MRTIRIPLCFTLVALCDFVFCNSALAQGAQTLAGTGAYTSDAFAGGELRDITCDIMEIVGGKFGGMLLTAAGIVAMTYAAFGDAKYTTSLITVGVGAFAISSMISIYFGDLGCDTATGNQNREIIRTNDSANPALRILGLEHTEAATLPHGDDSTDDPFDF